MRFQTKSFPLFLSLIGLFCGTVLLTGCAGGGGAADSTAKGADANTKSGAAGDFMSDPLMRGDKIEIALRGIPVQIPPSVQIISQDGSISLENIGSVQAAGLTPKQLEEAIHDKYVPSYYTHITVNVTPQLRYFYVLGMVHSTSSGGRQTYTSAITLTQAIASAGDFTDYADQRHVRLTHVRDGKTIVVDCKKILKKGGYDPQVAPGDTIFVPRRVF
jgi:protein involved in polysaccharide export with SLBB domain